jgi:hypothetical protein
LGGPPGARQAVTKGWRGSTRLISRTPMQRAAVFLHPIVQVAAAARPPVRRRGPLVYRLHGSIDTWPGLMLRRICGLLESSG